MTRNTLEASDNAELDDWETAVDAEVEEYHRLLQQQSTIDNQKRLFVRRET